MLIILFAVALVAAKLPPPEIIIFNNTITFIPVNTTCDLLYITLGTCATLKLVLSSNATGFLEITDPIHKCGFVEDAPGDWVALLTLTCGFTITSYWFHFATVSVELPSTTSPSRIIIQQQNAQLNAPMIAGIVVGGAIVLIIIAIITYRRRYKIISAV